MNKLKILFTMTPPFNPNDGGVQQTTFKLGKKFTELGHDVYYFSMSNLGNIEVDYGQLKFASNQNGVDSQLNLKELREYVYTIKPDFVINQMPYEFKMSELLSKEKEKLKYILLGCLRNSLFSVKNNTRDVSKLVLPNFIFKIFDNKIGLFILLQAHRFKHKKQLKKILDLHDKFILLAPPNRDELKYFVGSYKQNKVSVISNSIPSVFNEDIKKEKIILHVGRLNIPQKRSDLLLPFWKEVCDKLKDWEFVIVGDGPYGETMRQEIIKNKIPRVKMIGYQKPEEWYKRSSIFVMTSAFEGFPNVILEAQSFGCVSLAYKSYDAISWIVNNNKDAILIEPYKIKEMSDSVLLLTKDENKLKSMAIEAKRNASKFVIDNIALDWIKLFKSQKKL